MRKRARGVNAALDAGDRERCVAGAACSVPKKSNCSPVSVQTYVNNEYQAGDGDDNHSTLPIRTAAESADNASADISSFVNAGQSTHAASIYRSRTHKTFPFLSFSLSFLSHHTVVWLGCIVYFLLWPPYAIGQAIVFFALWFLSSFFSLPIVTGGRLDVYHTATHNVALVQI